MKSIFCIQYFQRENMPSRMIEWRQTDKLLRVTTIVLSSISGSLVTQSTLTRTKEISRAHRLCQVNDSFRQLYQSSQIAVGSFFADRCGLDTASMIVDRAFAVAAEVRRGPTRIPETSRERLSSIRLPRGIFAETAGLWNQNLGWGFWAIVAWKQSSSKPA